MLLEIVVIVISFLGLILQSSFFEYFSLLGVKPDIVLTCIVFYAVFNGYKKGLLIGGIIGLIEDLFIGQFIGPMIISRMLLGVAVGYFSRNIYKENYIIPIIILFVSTFFSNAFLWIFHSFYKASISFKYFMNVSFLQSIYNLIFMPFFYVINYNVFLKDKQEKK